MESLKDKDLIIGENSLKNAKQYAPENQETGYILGYIKGAQDQLKITFDENEVLRLMKRSFNCAWNKYDVVEAGLETKDTDTECRWILNGYIKRKQNEEKLG